MGYYSKLFNRKIESVMKTIRTRIMRASILLVAVFPLLTVSASAQDEGFCQLRCDGISVTVMNLQAIPYTLSSVALFWGDTESFWSRDLDNVPLPEKGETRIGYGDIVTDFDADRDAGYPRVIVLMLEDANREVTAQAFMGDEVEGYSFAPMLTESLQRDGERPTAEESE